MDFNNIEFDNLFNVINQIFLIPDCLDKTQFKFHLINNIPDINIKNYYLNNLKNPIISKLRFGNRTIDDWYATYISQKIALLDKKDEKIVEEINVEDKDDIQPIKRTEKQIEILIIKRIKNYMPYIMFHFQVVIKLIYFIPKIIVI